MPTEALPTKTRFVHAVPGERGRLVKATLKKLEGEAAEAAAAARQDPVAREAEAALKQAEEHEAECVQAMRDAQALGSKEMDELRRAADAELHALSQRLQARDLSPPVSFARVRKRPRVLLRFSLR